MTISCFLMMQFRGEHQNVLFRKIEEAIIRFNKIEGYSIELARADLTPPLTIENLEDHLKAYIDKSDFVIAEITELNPNVLFEMGYAIGVKKPLIIMVREGTDVPADFRGRLYFQYKESDLNLVPQMLQGYIKSAVDSLLVQQYQSTFSVTGFKNRGVSDLRQSLVDAQKNVDILTTNLDYFVSSGFPQIMKDKLKKCPGIKIRILTLDPESDFTAERAKQLGSSIRVFRKQLRESIEETNIILTGCGERFKMATYDEFPTQVTFRIDNAVYMNVVSAYRRSRENILFVLKTGNAGVASSFLNHFEAVWARSDVLPTEDKT